MKARAIKTSDLPRGPHDPVEIYLFNMDEPFVADVSVFHRFTIAVNQVTQRVADKTAPPLQCMTCDHAFVAAPRDVGFFKPMFRSGGAVTMAFCPTCAALPRSDLTQRILARLGGGYEVEIGKA
jgi:hypothetical protein